MTERILTLLIAAVADGKISADEAWAIIRAVFDFSISE